MKISEIIEICNAAIPRAVEYTSGEPYGPQNIPSLDMDVKKILFCVTPTPAVRKHFNENGYDLLISHHPYSAGVPQLIYHTALDCCQGGLNDMWALSLGMCNIQHFDKDLGWYGDITPTPFSDLVKKVQDFAGAVEGQVYCEGNRTIKTVVVCSGLGGLVDDLALQSGAECYITGECRQPATSMGFKAVIETGHTNSEWMGVRFFKKLFSREIHNGSLRIDLADKEIDVYGTEFYRNKKAKLFSRFDGSRLGESMPDIDEDEHLFDDGY